jgi:hypothetical protein
MAPAFHLARVAVRGTARFLADARAYGGLNRDERHLFWKRVQAAAFLALMPVFLAMGVACRAVSRLFPSGR